MAVLPPGHRAPAPRGNKVFVLVGPFNEHMLSDTDAATYNQIKTQAAAWFRRTSPYFVPSSCRRRTTWTPAIPSAKATHCWHEDFSQIPRFADLGQMTVAGKCVMQVLSVRSVP